MILAIDVGNTNITCGVFEQDEIVASFRITTKMPRTSDEYAMNLKLYWKQIILMRKISKMRSFVL